MNQQKGQVIILSFIFMVVMLLLAAGLFGFVSQNINATRSSLAKEQALELADAGIDKAIWQLNQTAGAYTGETGTVLGAGFFDVTITSLSGNLKEIRAIGYVPDKTTPKAIREVKVQATINTTSVRFTYALQIGAGGLEMENNAQVTGNVYSNGPVEGDSGARITGDAFSAGALGRIFRRLRVDGNAHAHRIDDTNVTVGGSAYGQIMDRVTVGGNIYTNSMSNCTVGGNASYTTETACTVGGTQMTPYPGEPDPPILPFPIPDSQISDWKNVAAAGGTIIGDYSLATNGAQASLGPKKITGNMILSNSSVLTLTGPLWVVGNIDISNLATIRLAASYGSGSEVIVNDGWIHLSNNGNFAGSGTAGSYLMFVNTSFCGNTQSSPCTHHGAAIDFHNNATGAVFYAPNGMVNLHNNVGLKELTAYKIKMDNNTTVTYESGLADVNFTGGPGGSWQIVRGTWREIK